MVKCLRSSNQMALSPGYCLSLIFQSIFHHPFVAYNAISLHPVSNNQPQVWQDDLSVFFFLISYIFLDTQLNIP